MRHLICLPPIALVTMAIACGRAHSPVPSAASEASWCREAVIHPRKSPDKCLGFSATATWDGPVLKQFPCEKNERWQMFNVCAGSAFGHQQIKNVFSHKCLGVREASPNAGDQVVQWECNGNAREQKFLIEEVGNYYVIKPEHSSNKCLAIREGSTEDGVDVIQWDCISGAEEQQFEIVPVN